jgi:large subunit ribosomal protein L31e
MKKEIENKTEREYVIPLRSQVMKVPGYKRAKKAVRTIREFLVQHMQVRDRDLNKIRLDKYLNQMLWSRGMKNPPHKIKVKAIKEGDIIRVEAYELSEKLKFRKQREDKRDKKSAEQTPKKKEEKKDESKEDKTEKSTELKTEEDKKIKEETEKKKTTIEAGQKYEKQKAKEKKHETSQKRPIQNKKEHSKGTGTGR